MSKKTVNSKELQEEFRKDVAIQTEKDIVRAINATGATVIEAFAALADVYFDIIESNTEDVKKRTLLLDFVMEKLVACANEVQKQWNDELDEPLYEPGENRYAVSKN